LAIHVASLVNPAFGIAGAVYSIVMYFGAIFPVLIGIKKDKE
jgi:flagellar motor component MotA